MTQGWHNRGVATVASIAALVAATRADAFGRRTDVTGGPWSTVGFTNGLGAVPLPVGVAALGPRMLRMAGRVADRVVLNMLAPHVVTPFLDEIAEGARHAGRPRPPVTVFTNVALDPTEASAAAGRRLLAGYVRVPGYDRAMVAHGFGEVVERAHRASSLREIEGLIPERMLVDVLGFGDADALRARLEAYRELQVDVAVNTSTAADPGGLRALDALRPA